MSTHRERRLAKAERLRDWADKREAKAESAFGSAHSLADQIPFGQPILVGHHSERRARNDQKRIEGGMRRGIENSRKAEDFRDRADNIEAAADNAIYSDDENAVERLHEKLATLEDRRQTIKDDNAAYRKAHRDELKSLSAYQKDQVMPHPKYELTNLGGNISRTKKRLASLEAEANGAGRWIDARFPGTCAKCGAATARGDLVLYRKSTRSVECRSCSAPVAS